MHTGKPTAARTLVHQCLVPIRWGDLDAYGHVNNTVYFRYMEQARVEWLEQLHQPLGAHGQGPVIVNASCTFLVPLGYPGQVQVRTFIEAPGRSSFQTHVEMRLQGDDRLVAEGAAKVVWIDTGTARSVPIPEPLRNALLAGFPGALG